MCAYRKEKVMELRAVLEIHLDTLTRNIEAVSLPVLQTKFKKPYERLRKDIRTATADYITAFILQDFRLRKEYLEEAVPIIRAAIRQSGLVSPIHALALEKQDISAMDDLAVALRENIQQALEPFYDRHLCLYVTNECFGNDPQIPDIYNYATGCILKDGTWVPIDEDSNAALLLFVAQKHGTLSKNATAAERLDELEGMRQPQLQK